MPTIVATFDKLCAGGGTVTNETWIDLSSLGPDSYSPIPAGKQMWLGFITCIAYGKSLTFEVRPNNPGQSAGNLASTTLRSFVATSDGQSGIDDMNYNGLIQTLVPSEPSTGVEKLWLRVRSSNNSAGSWEVLLYYTQI